MPPGFTPPLPSQAENAPLGGRRRGSFAADARPGLLKGLDTAQGPGLDEQVPDGRRLNGSGEAREADVGIAAEKGRGVLFRRGKPVRKVPEAELLDVRVEEIRLLNA